MARLNKEEVFYDVWFEEKGYSMMYGLMRRRDIFFGEERERNRSDFSQVNPKRKIMPRRKCNKGFSLPEMMLSLLILGFVSMLMATGIPTAAEALTRAVDTAHAQVLLSTTMTSLRNELTTASEVTKSEGYCAIVYKDGNGRYNRIYLASKDGDKEIKNEEEEETGGETGGETEEECWIWIKTLKRPLSPLDEDEWKEKSEKNQWNNNNDEKYEYYKRLLITESASTSNLHIEFEGTPDVDKGVVTFEGLKVMKNNSPLAEYEGMSFMVRTLGS